MADVADILGVSKESSEGSRQLGQQPAQAQSRLASKPSGMSREVFDLLTPQDLQRGYPLDPKNQKNNHHHNHMIMIPHLPTLVPRPSSNQLDLAHLKQKRNIKASKWTWAIFSPASQPQERRITPDDVPGKDEESLRLYHWVKGAGPSSTNPCPVEYPFARFNAPCHAITLEPAEYETIVEAQDLTMGWTRAETEHLLLLCQRYTLRWPVIADRFHSHFTEPDHHPSVETTTKKKCIEVMKHRYYTLATLLHQHRMASSRNSTPALSMKPETAEDMITEATGNNRAMADTASGVEVSTTTPITAQERQPQQPRAGLDTIPSGYEFQLEHEQKRKHQLDLMFRRTPESEAAILDCQKQIQLLDQRLKKQQKQRTPASGTTTSLTSSPGLGLGLGGGIPALDARTKQKLVQSVVHNSGSSQVQLPPGVYLRSQSQRLTSNQSTKTVNNPHVVNPKQAALNEQYKFKVEALLKELRIPERPLPTARVCQIFDLVREDVMKLLSLQKLVVKKEKEGHEVREKIKMLQTPSSYRPKPFEYQVNPLEGSSVARYPLGRLLSTCSS